MLLDDQPRTIFAIKHEKFGRKTQFLASAFAWAGIGLALAANFSAIQAAEGVGKVYALQPRSEIGQLQQVQAVVEVQGHLKLDAEGGKVNRVPLLVNAQLRYDEKLLASQAAPWSRRGLRYYEQAEASIKVGEAALAIDLSNDRRLVAAQVDKDGATLHSPAGPLTRDELDLVESQGQSLLWWSLFPTKPVSIGSRWEVDQEAFGLLLGVDAVTQCSVSCSLTSVDGDVALVEIAGSLSGAVSGVGTEIQLKAKCNFHLRQRYVTWFVASFKENRAISHAEPGFEVTTRIRASATPLQQSTAFSGNALDGLPLEPKPEATLLTFQAEKSHFRMIHDRRWRVIVDRPNLCVLRMIDRGALIAQVNVSELPDAEPSKSFTMEAFQADIERSLGKNFGQFVEAQQSKSADGTSIYRVVVSGTTGEVEIQWIYYHLRSVGGRRAALAFTLETKVLERFAEADRTLAETWQFTERPEAKPAETREAGKPASPPMPAKG